jgi:hypothetical protein
MTEERKPPGDATERATAYERETLEARDYLDRLHGDGVSDVHPYEVRRRWEKPPSIEPQEHSSEVFVPRKLPLRPSLITGAIVLSLFAVMAYVIWDALLRS